MGQLSFPASLSVLFISISSLMPNAMAEVCTGGFGNSRRVCQRLKEEGCGKEKRSWKTHERDEVCAVRKVE